MNSRHPQGQAESTRDCVTTAFARPFTSIDGTGLGIGIAHSEERDPEQLIKSADHAMHEIKTRAQTPPGQA